MSEVEEMEEVKPKKRTPKSKIEVVCAEPDYLKKIKFDMDWLQKVGTQYGIDKFEYIQKYAPTTKSSVRILKQHRVDQLLHQLNP